MTKNTDTDDILDSPVDDVQDAEAAAVINDEADNQSSSAKKAKGNNFFANISLDSWVIICSLFAIGLQFLATMLMGITGSYVVYKVFAYIGYAAVIASATIYVVNLLKNREVAFTPQLVLLILAVIVSVPFINVPLF